MTRFGIHISIQDNDLAEVLRLSRYVDSLGYHWVSVSDHLPGAVGCTDNIEAVVAQTAIAGVTSRVTCAVLVHPVTYRHPALIAAAASSVDHLSGGRAAVGLGIGGDRIECDLYGFEFPPVPVREEMLEESVQSVAALLHDEIADFKGKYFQISSARNRPRPVQERLPVWIGARGARGIRSAARYADGWNLALASAEEFAERRHILRRHCREAGRDPADVLCSVNVGLARSAGAFAGISGPARTFWQSASLIGTADQVMDGVGRYVAAGADLVSFYVRHPPYDYELLAAVAAALDLGGQAS